MTAPDAPGRDLVAYDNPLLAVVVYEDPDAPLGAACQITGRVPKSKVPDLLRTLADQAAGQIEDELAAVEEDPS